VALEIYYAWQGHIFFIDTHNNGLDLTLAGRGNDHFFSTGFEGSGGFFAVG